MITFVTMKVYAAFITFFPNPQRFKAAFNSVEKQVEKVIVIDNTTNNEGIAHALNKAFEQASMEGCDYLITFDQDSIAPSGLVSRLLEDIAKISNIGQIGPAYSNLKTEGSGVVDKSHIITSGSLTSVKAWEKVGGFRDDYFIDYVDIEFSLNLRRHAYRVLMDQSIVLDHQLGEGLIGWDIFGKKRLGFVDHVPVRWYYIVRNCCMMVQEYKKEFPEFTSQMMRDLRRRVFRMALNGHDILPRLKMTYEGWRDYRHKVAGKYR